MALRCGCNISTYKHLQTNQEEVKVGTNQELAYDWILQPTQYLTTEARTSTNLQRETPKAH
jgi:hypothetical protein